ncbi:pseudaminic acid synthase [Algoriphagus sp. AGSA1]|uniref:pseudaminic acid synthase n=1 Tax=Algoriphagus sp. AGSA1 TaxID=2907213 RepID=UPI001F44A5C3|nr:pseudaminic acid synthase [Algoriphagus sp. AGSA1]MCE7055301.1 pseudaminic acid synthase [Algoriphagus sp. AGSA1]
MITKKNMSSKGTFIIAEMSANHGNDYEIAVRTIEEMAKCGANAVKVQTYTADSLTLNVDNEYFGPRKQGLWKGQKPYDVFKEGAMPYEWQPRLKMVAEDLGLEFFSSPFDFEAVDFLEKMGVSRYKIASFEITDIPLIEYTASKKKPMIISTGVAELVDIERAVNICRKVGNEDITLLKCTSEYPATADQANLLTIPNLRDTFGVKVGVSDHSMGSTIPIVAVSLGASVVEKHFILDRTLGGPDSGFSMEPHEFADMVIAIREAEASLGQITYQVSPESKLRRRSLFLAQDIKKGELFTKSHIRSVRPGNGISPIYYNQIIGKEAVVDLSKGQPIKFSYFK